MLLAKLVDELQHGDLVTDVERTGRLVEAQDRRLLGRSPGRCCPLNLAPDSSESARSANELSDSRVNTSSTMGRSVPFSADSRLG